MSFAVPVTAHSICRPVRLVVNDCKFLARTIFFSHTKLASSNNPRSYTIVSAPVEQAVYIVPFSRSRVGPIPAPDVILFSFSDFVSEIAAACTFYKKWPNAAIVLADLRNHQSLGQYSCIKPPTTANRLIEKDILLSKFFYRKTFLWATSVNV